MAESKKGHYYDGRTHFSYNDDLTYHTHQFKAHETVQSMIQRAQQSMTDNSAPAAGNSQKAPY